MIDDVVGHDEHLSEFPVPLLPRPQYATESEVIRDGLRALLARDRAVESWLHHQVGPAYDALKAEPSRAVTIDQVRARLAAEHAKAR
jgi:antitoxin ParD1/3/4